MDNSYSSSNVEQTARNIESDVNTWASDAADAVQDAASSVRDRASEFSQTAGDKARAAADYFRDQGFDGVVEDLRTYVREHPTQALVGALAVGFTLATLLRRR